MAGPQRRVLQRARDAGDDLSEGVERMVAAQALATASDLFQASPDAPALLRGAARVLANEPGAMCLVSLADKDVLKPYVVAHRDVTAQRQLEGAVTASRDAGVTETDAFSQSVQRSAGALRMAISSMQSLRLWLPRAYWAYAERARVDGVLAAALARHGEVLGAVLLWREAGQGVYAAADQAYVQALVQRLALGL